MLRCVAGLISFLTFPIWRALAVELGCPPLLCHSTVAPVCLGSLFWGWQCCVLAGLLCAQKCCRTVHFGGVSSGEQRGSRGTPWQGVCFPLWAEALLVRAQEGISCLSGLFAHFCDYLLVCWEMTYSPCETQTSLYHTACITLMEFCQLRIKCGLRKQL